MAARRFNNRGNRSHPAKAFVVKIKAIILKLRINLNNSLMIAYDIFTSNLAAAYGLAFMSLIWILSFSMLLPYEK